MSPVLRLTRPPAMSREAFRVWVLQQPRGRYERVDGTIFAMSPERLGHALIKGRAWRALDDALLSAGTDCVAVPDGATVEIGDSTDYKPDVIVTCGDTLDLDSIAAPRPVIVVEVTSPGTRGVDTSQRFIDDFKVPSIHHYLIVAAPRVEIVHHRRTMGGMETRVLTDGDLELDPPGISVPVAAFYVGLSL